MRKFCCTTILSFALIVGISCQKEVTKTQWPIVIQKAEGVEGKPPSVLEAEAVKETIAELQQQGLIK